MKNEKVRNAMAQINKQIFKHEIISSSILTFLLGLVIGGIATGLEWLLA